jgi:hypothetical protein
VSQETLEMLEALDGEIHDLSERKVTQMSPMILAEHLFYLMSVINRVLRLMLVERMGEND